MHFLIELGRVESLKADVVFFLGMGIWIRKMVLLNRLKILINTDIFYADAGKLKDY